LDDFAGWVHGTISVSASAGISFGLNFSFYKDESAGILFAVTKSIGIGVGHTVLGGYAGRSFTKQYKIWGN